MGNPMIIPLSPAFSSPEGESPFRERSAPPGVYRDSGAGPDRKGTETEEEPVGPATDAPKGASGQLLPLLPGAF